MDIILLRRVEKLGQMGEIVKVAPGYFRNFLLPKGFADRATKERITQFESNKAYIEAENLKEKQQAEQISTKMDKTVLTFIRSAGETGLLYGSVRSQEIVAEMDKHGFKIERSQVLIKNPIKTLGIHTVSIVLHPEVQIDINLNIALTQEEADNQLSKMLSSSKSDPTSTVN